MIGGTPDGSFALSTARSVSTSRPTMLAGTLVPSANSTSTVPPLAAMAITWLLVRM